MFEKETWIIRGTRDDTKIESEKEVSKMTVGQFKHDFIVGDELEEFLKNEELEEKWYYKVENEETGVAYCFRWYNENTVVYEEYWLETNDNAVKKFMKELGVSSVYGMIDLLNNGHVWYEGPEHDCNWIPAAQEYINIKEGKN